MLAGADGIGSGCIHHRNTAPRRGLDVDRIDARSRARDHAQVWRTGHQTRRDTRFTADDQRVSAGDRLIQLRRLARDVDDFDVGCFGEQV